MGRKAHRVSLRQPGCRNIKVIFRQPGFFNVTEAIMKKINPLEVVQEQYQYLKEKLRSTHDVREMKVIIKRLINLVGVMQFLISISKNS